MRIILVLLFLNFGSVLTAQNDYFEEYIQKFYNGSQYTIEVAQMMPEELYDYKPAPEVRTFREQVMHIMNNMVWLSSSYLLKVRFDQIDDLKKKDLSKEEIVHLLRKSTLFARNAVKSMKPEDLEKPVDFFAGPMTKRQILTLMNDHMTHHRGQIIVYLRINGFKPPSYRGW